MGAWADDAIRFARKTGASVRSTLRCARQRPGISHDCIPRLARPYRVLAPPRRATTLTGSSGTPKADLSFEEPQTERLDLGRIQDVAQNTQELPDTLAGNG